MQAVSNVIGQKCPATSQIDTLNSSAKQFKPPEPPITVQRIEGSHEIVDKMNKFLNCSLKIFSPLAWDHKL